MQAFVASSTYVGDLDFFFVLFSLKMKFPVATKSVSYNKGVNFIWRQGKGERSEGLSLPKLMGIWF